MSPHYQAFTLRQKKQVITFFSENELNNVKANCDNLKDEFWRAAVLCSFTGYLKAKIDTSKPLPNGSNTRIKVGIKLLINHIHTLKRYEMSELLGEFIKSYKILK